MSLSVRRYAEPMNQVCRLMVKINFQGHGIYPLQFPVRSISPEPFERLSLNFTQMFLSARRCAEHMTQLWSLEVSECHSSRSWDLPFKLVSATYLQNPLKVFHPIFSLSEMECRSNDSAVKTLKGHCHIFSYQLMPQTPCGYLI